METCSSENNDISNIPPPSLSSPRTYSHKRKHDDICTSPPPLEHNHTHTTTTQQQQEEWRIEQNCNYTALHDQSLSSLSQHIPSNPSYSSSSSSCVIDLTQSPQPSIQQQFQHQQHNEDKKFPSRPIPFHPLNIIHSPVSSSVPSSLSSFPSFPDEGLTYIPSTFPHRLQHINDLTCDDDEEDNNNNDDDEIDLTPSCSPSSILTPTSLTPLFHTHHPHHHKFTYSMLCELSPEQQAVIVAVKQKKNVFFTGSAGTGKSYLLRILQSVLPSRGTYFTASTGLAAVNIKGTTLHSFAGIGLGQGSVEHLAKQIMTRHNTRTWDRWKRCQVLVIDEISMIPAQLFEKIEHLARIVRNNNERFGGIQLIISGDFLQLPPVQSTKPTYDTPAWNKCIDVQVLLTTIYRQANDPHFAKLLNDLRVGDLSIKNLQVLKKSHYNELELKHGILPTKLYSTRRSVKEENEEFLHKLEGDLIEFRAQDYGNSPPHIQLLQKNCPAADIIQLKKGAQVMCIKNIDTDAGICNGSRGVVISFVLQQSLMQGGYNYTNDDGNTIDLTSDNNNNNSPGQSAFIKANQLPSTFNSMNGSNGWTGGRIVSGNRDELSYVPLVRFENGVERIMTPEKWEIEVGDKVMATRQQIPLTLAWALTIHKSQGLTLEQAEIEGCGMFESGQFYVAISRVRSLRGLKLVNFTQNSVRTDKKVVEFYKQLENNTEGVTRTLLEQLDNMFPDFTQWKKKWEEQKAAKQYNNVEEKKQQQDNNNINIKIEASSVNNNNNNNNNIAVTTHIKIQQVESKENHVSVDKQVSNQHSAIMQTSLSFQSEITDNSPRSPPCNTIQNSSSSSSPPPASATNPCLPLCVVCDHHPACHVILPCMHVCLCQHCSVRFHPPQSSSSSSTSSSIHENLPTQCACPICRADIQEVKRLFFCR